jgi:hypothetical protein
MLDVGLTLHFTVKSRCPMPAMMRSRVDLPEPFKTQQTDLGAREKGEGDVFEDMTLGRNHFAHAEHRHYILGHGFNLCLMGKNE